jgi:hypothetical protein
MGLNNEEIINIVKKDPSYIKKVESPSEEIKWAAIKSNIWIIEYIKELTEDMELYCVNKAWNTLKFIKNPSSVVLEAAVKSNGWALQFINDPSEELQALAIKSNWESIRYIKFPSENIQELAVSKNYNAIKLIESPTIKVKISAVRSNAEAIKHINYSDGELKTFIKENLDVLKYLDDIKETEVLEIIKGIISEEEVEKEFIKKLILMNWLSINIVNFVYKYGSKRSKRFYVDYSLE